VTLVVLSADRTHDMAALHALAFAAPWDAKAFAALLDGPGVFALGVEEMGALDAEVLCGLILMRAIAGEAEVLTLATAPGLRRRGVARALLEAALQSAAVHGARQAFLEVAHDNIAAIALYERAGFSPVGRRPAYYARPFGGAADALVLSRTLAVSDA
jgi:ribosomal-protein-alanine N-acetyltransferase